MSLNYTIVAEHHSEEKEEAFDVTKHITLRFLVKSSIHIHLLHRACDFISRPVDKHLLSIALGDQFELVSFISTPCDQAVHEVSSIYSMVGSKSDNESMIKSAGTLHEGILLLLKHLHDLVHDSTVRSGRTCV